MPDSPEARKAATNQDAVCICGHARRYHGHASDAYPTVCTYEVAPGEDWPVCSCLEFEDEEDE